MHFVVSLKRLIDDPRFWYFCASLDLKPMNFRDPAFLVPSRFVHAHGRKVAGGRVSFTLNMSLAPGSHDQWSGYRVSPLDLGKRIVEIIEALPLGAAQAATVIAALQDVVFVTPLAAR